MKKGETFKKMRLGNEKGMLIVWLYILIVGLLITSGSLYAVAFSEATLMARSQASDRAFYLAEAGVDRKLAELATANYTNISSGTFIDAAITDSGSFSVSYCGAGSSACTSPNGSKSLVTSTGTFNGINRSITVTVQTATIPIGVQGAVSVYSNVTTGGGIVIDGRDHDSSGNLTGAPGTYGIVTTGSLTQQGSSQVGGQGIAPADPGDPASYLVNQPSNGFTTPEEILGVPAGSLDAYKTSSVPSFPMSGIIYYTGDKIQSQDFGSSSNPSTGILILNNSAGDSLLKNVQGNFKGLIITDELNHVNSGSSILGALVTLDQAGNVIGNGNASIKYSSAILSSLPQAGGGGGSSVSVVSWEDGNNA